MKDECYFFDTYAILEIINANDSYRPYLQAKVIINDFIFAELCFILIRRGHPQAKELLNGYSLHILQASPRSIEAAMLLRSKEKKRNLSIPDCVAYLHAQELGLKFLTGDKEFEGLKHVEFVKK